MIEEILIKLRGNRSKAEFGKLIGVSGQAIANYEEGRLPKKEILEKIATATGYRITIKLEKVEE